VVYSSAKPGKYPASNNDEGKYKKLGEGNETARSPPRRGWWGGKREVPGVALGGRASEAVNCTNSTELNKEGKRYL